MAYTEMSLPIDIPWKRMSASEDMIDEEVGDLKFPEKWRSSIAVFYHEPEDLPPEYCSRKITYLKVVCTITNFQLPSFQEMGTIRGKRYGIRAIEDITILEDMRKNLAGFYADIAKDFDARVTDSYPCYGALVQVGVYPNPAKDEEGNKIKKQDYPYIIAFQPRKREMYEVLTEAGEVASQSSAKLNILKGSTNTETNEEYDLDLGGGSGGHSGGWGLWSEQHTHPNKQVGTIDRYNNQYQNVTTRDASREKRESYSYTTSLNQLYTLLQSYHLGTNRALFFLQPRPHTKDIKMTFIRGLRRLEGIQEFFLIVNRPKSIPGFCVEVALETAHTYSERAYRAHLITESELRDPNNLKKTAIEADEAYLSNIFPHEFKIREVWNTHDYWIRYLAHHYLEGHISDLRSCVDSGKITIEDFALMRGLALTYPNIGLEKIELIFDEYESDSGYFFITGRQLCSCFLPAKATDNDSEAGGEADTAVDIENSDETHISTCGIGTSVVITNPFTLSQSITPEHSLDSVTTAQNTLVQQLNDFLISSIGSKDRLPYGEGSFLETEFILEEMSQLVRLLGKAGVKDQELGKVKDIRKYIESGLGKISGAKSIKDLGELPTEMIARDLNRSTREARKIRRDLLTAALGSLDVKTVSKDFKQLNPILERIDFISKGKFRRLEKNIRTSK